MTLKDIENKIRKFNAVRGWDKDEKSRDIAISVSVEAAELLEHFQWHKDEYKDEKIGEEIADVFIYLMRLSYSLGYDMEELFLKKIEKNGKNIPKKLLKKLRVKRDYQRNYKQSIEKNTVDN